MLTELIEKNKKLVLPYVEEPVREILLGLWQLPFVLDTSEICSGHIVTTDSMIAYFSDRYNQSVPEHRRLYWYPHGIRLGITYSLEEHLKNEAKNFREEFLEAGEEIELFGREYLPYQQHGPKASLGLKTSYWSDFPKRPEDFTPPQEKIAEYITAQEAKLARFWGAVGSIIMKYNPLVEIGSVAGKNFRNVKNGTAFRGEF